MTPQRHCPSVDCSLRATGAVPAGGAANAALQARNRHCSREISSGTVDAFDDAIMGYTLPFRAELCDAAQ